MVGTRSTAGSTRAVFNDESNNDWDVHAMSHTHTKPDWMVSYCHSELKRQYQNVQETNVEGRQCPKKYNLQTKT